MSGKKGNNYIIFQEQGIAKIELNRRKGENLWAIIDLEDLDRVLNIPYTWFVKYDEDIKSYYAVTSWYYQDLKRSKPVHLHQFIMNANGKIVDHENHDTLDDRKSNLRVIADSNNSKNRRTRNSNNKSGYRNVCWSEKENKWIVQLQVNKKNTVLGRFPKEQLEDAGKFAEQKRKEIYGEFAGHN